MLSSLAQSLFQIQVKVNRFLFSFLIHIANVSILKAIFQPHRSHIYGIYSSKFPSLLHNAFQEVLETHHGVTTIILDVMQHDMQLAGSDPIYLNWSSNCFFCGKKREFACNSEGIYLLSLYLQNRHIMNSLEAHLRALWFCSYFIIPSKKF